MVDENYKNSDFSLKPKNKAYFIGTINYSINSLKIFFGDLVKRYDADVTGGDFKPTEKIPRERFIAKKRKKQREKLEKKVNHFEMYER
jgi:hypothetical protein